MSEDLTTPPSPKNMQSEFSLGMAQTKNPNYKTRAFAEAAEDYLKAYFKAGDKKPSAYQVGEKGDHFETYAEDLVSICDILGQPRTPFCGSFEDRVKVLDIIRVSKRTPVVKHLVEELWGLKFTKMEARPEHRVIEGLLGGSAVAPKDISNALVTMQKNGRLKAFLESASQNGSASHKADLNEFFDILSDGIEASEQLARDYLESMLLIGAALLYFRFQRALMDESEAKLKRDEMYAILKKRLGKETDSALEAALGRIGRAYRKSLAEHLSIEEPPLSDKKALWSFYQKSLEEIPKFLDRVFAGENFYKSLAGIPNLPRIEREDNAEEASTTEVKQPEAKMAQAIFRESVDDYLKKFNKKKPEEQALVIDSAFLAYENLSDFFGKLEPDTLRKKRKSLKTQIQRLQELEQRLD